MSDDPTKNAVTKQYVDANEPLRWEMPTTSEPLGYGGDGGADWKGTRFDDDDKPKLTGGTMTGPADLTTIDPKKFLLDDPQTFVGAFTFNEIPWFPFTITLPLPAPGSSVTLFADGKWEGSIEALRTALADGKSLGGDAVSRMLLWLILRQMEADSRQW